MVVLLVVVEMRVSWKRADSRVHYNSILFGQTVQVARSKVRGTRAGPNPEIMSGNQLGKLPATRKEKRKTFLIKSLALKHKIYFNALPMCAREQGQDPRPDRAN